MSSILITILLISLMVTGIIFLVIFFLYNRKPAVELNYNQIIQKKTYTLFFNTDGILASTSVNVDETNLLRNIKVGQHISDLSLFKNLPRYFETCKKSKKNIAVKLLEDGENNIARRHDLIFTPLIENEIVTGIFMVLQELISKSNDIPNFTNQKELEEQRNFALRQIDEIEAQKSELELAFKKSSKHHIMLQKALRKIETQKSDLENALEIINQQKKELENANKEIRESSRMKEIFLANTSHEIRTPLNAIIGFTNLLLSGNLDTNQQKYIEYIKASGNNLLVVINDILDFSKIESGKLTLEQIEFDFRNLIKHAVNTLQIKSQEKQIQLVYNIADNIPEIIIGDPVRLNQILINLLGNAIKFTNQNGIVKLFATLGSTEMGFIKILFKVEDNGIGIPRDKLHQIFHSFTQGESNTTRKYGGTGLGLSIVKQLIELQQGEITVESKLGQGTSFTFYVVLKPGDKMSQNHVKHRIGKVDSHLANHMNILLVEDNNINQLLAIDTIKSWNSSINIDLAVNGKIAVEKASNNNYHLILMDIQMPVMDGNEATQLIRKLPEPQRSTPIMAMTAHALKNEKENCIRQGMNDYLSKPFDPEELYIKIISFAPQPADISTSVILNNTTTMENELTSHPISDELFEYKHFNVINLKKIYFDNTTKIVKIVKMCHESIPNEITEIQSSFNNKEWEVLRNKAHALKPKFGYLGMERYQEKAREIEVASQDSEKRVFIQNMIDEIKDGWSLAEPEIAKYTNPYN